MFAFCTYEKSFFSFCPYRNQCTIVSPLDKKKPYWLSVWDFQMQLTLMGLRNTLFLIKGQIYFIESGMGFWFACCLMRVLCWWRKALLLVVITFISNGWSNAIQRAKFANQCYKNDLLCFSWTADVSVAYKMVIYT